MNQRISEYISALDRHNEAGKALNKAKNTLLHFIQVVQNPQTVYFTNGSVKALPAVTMKSNTSIDAKEWPSADQIQTMLNEWFEARQIAEQLYKQLSDNEKSLVQKPI